MNLLREYIRELLTESIDPKIMSMIDKAEKARWKVRLFPDHVIIGPPAEIEDDYGRGKVEWGSAQGGNSYEADFGNCSGAMMVGGSYADKGLGPLLYDVAIEATSGLMADRMGVSDEAENVWNKYMNSRPDIEAVQLDVGKDYNLPQLTPDNESDDCDQAVPVARMRYYGVDWSDSSLSKMYRKKGGGTPVMDELRRRGMLEER